MIIVDFHDFIRMPAGTVYAPYEPCVFGDFAIKTDTGYEVIGYDGKRYWDFLGSMPLHPNFADDDHVAFDKGVYETEMSVYDTAACDFDEEELFAVLEPHEVKRLINSLYWALEGCPGELEDFCEYMKNAKTAGEYTDIIREILKEKENAED